VRAVSLWGAHLNLPRVHFKRCGGGKQAELREKLAHKSEDNIGLSQTTQSIVIIISLSLDPDHLFQVYRNLCFVDIGQLFLLIQ